MISIAIELYYSMIKVERERRRNAVKAKRSFMQVDLPWSPANVACASKLFLEALGI